MTSGWIGVAVDVLVYAAGAGLTIALIRRWRPELSRRLGLGYALLAAVFVGPGLLTTGYQVPVDLGYRVGPWSPTLPELREVKNPLLQDVALQMFPFRTLVRECWLDGSVPLWAHELGAGQPLLGNAQTAPLSPHNLLSLPLPALRGMTVAVGWQLLLALLTMHGLVAHLAGGPVGGRAGPGAVLAAVSYAFSTFSVAWAYYPMGATAMWIPAVLLGLVTLAAGERRSFGALVLGGTGAALAGHPETLAHLAVLATVVAVALWWRRPAVGRGPFTRRLALAAMIAFGLAAPFLLPILETLDESERMLILEDRRAADREVVMPPIREVAPAVINPLVAGSPRDRNFNGPGNWNEAMSLYGGLLPLVLAVAGASMYRGRLAGWLAGGALALLGGFGHGPVLWLLEVLPVLKDGAHGRLRLLWILAVAVVGGWALERLLRGGDELPAARRRFVWVAGWALGVGALLLWLPPGGDPEGPAAAQTVWWAVTLAGLGVFLVVAVALAARGSAMPRRLGWLVVALTLVDLWVLGARYNPVVPGDLNMGTDGGRVPATVAELQRRQATTPPFRVLGEGPALMPNLAALYGLWQPRYNDPAAPGLASRFLEVRLAGTYRPGAIPSEQPGTFDPPFHDLMGVRWMLTAPPRNLPPPWKRGPRLGGMALWENPDALPLFFVPRTVELALDRRAAYRLALEITDFADRAVALREIPGEQSGSVAVTAVEPNGFELTVDSPTGGLVASSVAWAPGWRVRGREGMIDPEIVNGAFLGFQVLPGAHRLTVAYVPQTWWPAWGLFVLALIGWVIAGPGARAWRRGLRRSEDSDPA